MLPECLALGSCVDAPEESSGGDCGRILYDPSSRIEDLWLLFARILSGRFAPREVTKIRMY
jgi:hypothetical protein